MTRILDWTEAAPGVWTASVGEEAAASLLGLAAAPPKTDALEAMGEADFPLAEELITADRVADKVVLSLPLDSEENLYGLGLHFQTVSVRNKVFHLKVDHYGGRDDGRTHRARSTCRALGTAC